MVNHIDKTIFLDNNLCCSYFDVETDMYRFPCPHCLAKVTAATGHEGQKCRCPECSNRIYLIHEDDSNIREAFPAFQWQIVDDDKTSIEHQKIVELGSKGKGYYWLDDSAFKGWWEARRKGIVPCRCKVRLLHQTEIKKLGLEIEYVTYFDFDPWSPINGCVTISQS